MIKVAIIEDTSLWRLLIKDRLTKSGKFTIELICKDGEDFFTTYKNKEFDLILLDFDLPKENGFEIAKKIIEKNLNKPIIVFSALTRAYEQDIFYDIGVKACIPKSLINELDNEILKAMYNIKGCYNYVKLENDEKKLLIGICEGMTNKNIADLLCVEETTIEYRCRKLAEKVRIKNKRPFFISFGIKYGFWFLK